MSLCLYSRHLCGRTRLPGHDFCQVHILSSKSAPFKQCTFTTLAALGVTPGRRCENAAGAHASNKEGFCADHLRRALLARQKSGEARKRALHNTLEDLDHFKRERLESNDQKDKFQVLCEAIPASGVQRCFDDVTELDSRLGEDSSEELEPTVEESWRGDADSEADSVDSDLEDPLKHAGAFSAEEVIRTMRDKLIRLQKLYIDQFQRLQYRLREERRKFRHSLAREKEDLELVSLADQPKEDKVDIEAFDDVKSLQHYNSPRGTDAVLFAQLLEKRVRASEQQQNRTPQAQDSNVCYFNLTTSTKCGDICVPMSKFCMKHILEDPNQVLFRACAVTTVEADGPCQTAVPDLLEGDACVYHTQIPSLSHNEKEFAHTVQKRRNDQSDEPPQTVILPEQQSVNSEI